MTCFLFDVKFWQMDHVFVNFASAIICLICYCACGETARIVLPVTFLTVHLKSPWAVRYLNTNFGGASAEFYTCFERQTAFIMQNFRNLGTRGVGVAVKIFWRNPQKAHAWLISRVLSHWSCKFVHGFFSLGEPTKKGALQKVTERLYFTYLRGIPHPTNLN